PVKHTENTDPLQAPTSYTKTSAEEKKTVAKPKDDPVRPAPPSAADLAPEKLPGKTVATTLSPLTQGSAGIKEDKGMSRLMPTPVEKTGEKKPVVASTAETPKKETPPAPLPPIQSSVPLGMGSVAAASSPELDDMPPATGGKGAPVAVAERR